ncbi:MAG: PAS domain-containing sensor histidine kinase [Hyphomicrobium sp.]|jgi:two-component system nitrogen regulation sensor histidine kinase NtrY|uniref:sensor histidine kinase NtrY-like n=1 Tax=Hyphomicrobium sp. TaxID=82 RepID=UPI0025B85429|nr:PAS domain-containing sensor histidine kinase [Hyphomicrobium sp.]MBX9861275.1 PAS domain-containing sensor histidine kinase [Hyphomicrobium sp.]
MVGDGTASKIPPTNGAAAPLLDLTDRAFWIGLVVVVLSVVSALATYLILTGLTPIAPRDDVVLGALLINVVLIIAMIAVIAWQFFGMWQAWREKLPGARLHVRIVLLFSITAAVPAMLLAVAATTTFSRSLDSWFSTRTRAIINNSVEVAQAYVEEHGQLLRTDIANMVRDIDAAADHTLVDSPEFKQQIIAQAGLRDLPVAYVLDGQAKRVVSALEDKKLPFTSVPLYYVKQAETGQVALFTPNDTSQVSALAKLNRYPDRFLYVSRVLSAKVMGHLQQTEQSVDEYNLLRRARGGLKLAHGLIYTMISMTALLAAIWVGLWFASRFVAPIRRLIEAAQQVSRGNLAVELPERRGEGDLRRLSTTFNTMTRELKHQRDALMTANEQLVDRRRFMEAVLSGVSAGVIGLDSQDRITLVSRAAEQLLAIPEADVVGKRLIDTMPMLAHALERRDEPGMKQRGAQEISVMIGDEERTFAVRVTREKAGPGDVGSVVTFDDITELVSAQRTSAWADVARRIAHEIKNPLTPIILSAERIRRKYGRVIVEDRETFDKLTATIERQAGDIKTMVDEFASFARVPKPVMEHGDLRDAVTDSVILFRESHSAVVYGLSLPETPVLGSFDRRLLTQAVTNLVKNATEAVEGAAEADKSRTPRVDVQLSVGETVAIAVSDNGPGLPKQNRSRLLEPYVTTKGHKGTGLGLAIVQKITEQHGGQLLLDDAEVTAERVTGARVTLSFPRSMLTTDGAPAEGDSPSRAAE